MKIGDQAVDDLESIPGVNVKTRDPFIGYDPALSPRHPLESSSVFSANRNDSTAVFFCSANLRRGRHAQTVALPFHAVSLNTLTAHRLERPWSDVEGQ